MARWGYFGFRPYVPVAKRRQNALRHAQKLAKKGRMVQGVQIEGRTIARTFWGKAWCDNLESYGDLENRLPRGRTYLRNGSVVDLQIAAGSVTAVVSGSNIYEVTIKIDPLGKALWSKIKADCAQSIDSLLDLLAGRFSEGVMRRLTRQQDGLFPRPTEIKMRCSCPDWAYLCKHLAAVLYGVGARLDSEPDKLFLLRNVDHHELISQAVDRSNVAAALDAGSTDTLDTSRLGEVFGIDLDSGAEPSPPARPASHRRTAAKKAAAGKTPVVRKAAATKRPAAEKATARRKPGRRIT